MISYVSYNKLFKLMADKNMKKKDLAKVCGLSSPTMAKLSKNEYVAMEVIVRICQTLECQINEVMDILPKEDK